MTLQKVSSILNIAFTIIIILLLVELTKTSEESTNMATANKNLMDRITGYVMLDSSYRNESEQTVTEVYSTYTFPNGQLLKQPFFSVTRNIQDMGKELAMIREAKLKEHKPLITNPE